MIYSLRGKLIYVEPSFAVIECGGVGYRCAISLNTLAQLPSKGAETTLLTYMAVRDDSVDLFGFFDERELMCFKLLISVNGVGPRVALILLSDLSADKLTLAVASGDDKTLTQSSGVGKKLAQRIVLELKDKLGVFSQDDIQLGRISAAAPASGGAFSEAAAALVSLGYSQSESAAALSGCDESAGVEKMIKDALKQLSKKSY